MKSPLTARSKISAAAQKETARRLAYTPKLERLDGPLASAAIRALDSPAQAAAWLIERAYSLGGKIPVDFAMTPAGRAAVITRLGRIEYNVLA
jgi:uncharacterized protein (DUF2384 family)